MPGGSRAPDADQWIHVYLAASFRGLLRISFQTASTSFLNVGCHAYESDAVSLIARKQAVVPTVSLQDQVRDMLVQAGVSISGDVANTISGGTQQGPVLQGRDFNNLSFGASPASPPREGSDAG
ncbi:MAG TPA: hypothetical protein VFW50_14905 [Streptosporangiaceae bacterium]|nr:hypothetical protein [Streptosporangiaceae bacterium]